MQLIGSKTEEEFLQVGQEFLRYFQTLGKLKPTDTVLEIGCGCGRMALALKNITGIYYGVDVDKSMIDWCRKHISSIRLSFTFDHVDIKNNAFNPDGKLDNSDFHVNYYDHYDFIFLTSVFTHIMEDGLRHYLSEIAKALTPSGRVFATFFLINEESRRLINEEKADWNFCYPMDHGAYFIEKNPEAALAYNEDFIIELYRENGLEINDIYYGSWCGRENYLSYQDIIIAT